MRFWVSKFGILRSDPMQASRYVDLGSLQEIQMNDKLINVNCFLLY